MEAAAAIERRLELKLRRLRGENGNLERASSPRATVRGNPRLGPMSGGAWRRRVEDAMGRCRARSPLEEAGGRPSSPCSSIDRVHAGGRERQASRDRHRNRTFSNGVTTRKIPAPAGMCPGGSAFPLSNVFPELEGLARRPRPSLVIGRAPVLLDVLDHQVRAGEMAHARRAFGVVHRVGQVAHQRDVLAQVHHLPDGERPAQHAHVQMHAAEDDVVDPALAPAGSTSPGRRRVIASPSAISIAAICRVQASRILHFIVAVAAHVGVVDRQDRLALGVRPAPGRAPALGRRQRHRRLRERRRPARSFRCGVSL